MESTYLLYTHLAQFMPFLLNLIILVAGYPLRPELMESTYLLYTATRDPRLLGLGASLLGRLRDKNAAKCGYASVQDVSTGAGGQARRCSHSV